LVDLQNSFTAAKSSKFSTKSVLGCVAHALSMLLLYLGKLKNQKFALCMHAKPVSSVTFYHLCNRCLPNVMKINVKINTMQYQHFAFCLFTVLNVLKECLIALCSDFRQVIIDTAVDQ